MKLHTIDSHLFEKYNNSIKPIFPLLLLVFLLIFPKGGIKIAEIPFTWGYLFLFLATIPILFRRIQIVFYSHFRVILALIPFQIISISTLIVNGIDDISFAFSFIIHFLLFPFIFFLVFSKSMSELNAPIFFKHFKNGVFLISVYGICLFAFTTIFGFFFSIPLLTINLDDLGLLETTKCIARGDFFKLISTYNNGNLYGACVLLLLPLYLHIETKSWKRSIVKLSLLLTLSRTVWIGLFIVELFWVLYVQQLKIGNIFKLLFKCIALSIILSIIVLLINKDISFILDATLGGRYEEFYTLEEFYWVSFSPFSAITEIVYLSIYKNFGVFGLIAFIVGMTSPIWIYYFCMPNRDLIRFKTHTVQKAILAGLCTYLLLSFSDGAILLIPVMAFYWFLSALLLTPSNTIREK